MLEELEESVLQILQQEDINVLAWSGKAEDLSYVPKRLPAIRYILEKVDFAEKQSLNHYEAFAEFSLLVFFRSLKEKGQGAYYIIEDIINKLCTKIPNGFSLSLLNINLLQHQSSEFCWQIKFKAMGKYIITVPEEELVKRITLYENDELISDLISS